MAMKKKNNAVPFLIGGLALGGLLLGLRGASVTPGNITGVFDQGNDEEQVKEALKTVANMYGREFAIKLEQLLRLETAHFSSGQWKKAHTAGMEATKNTWPYGWSSLDEFINIFNSLQLYPDQFSTVAVEENQTDDIEEYIVFPSAYDFILFLAWFIKNKRGGRFGNWYSMNEASAQSYENNLSTIVPRYMNLL